MIAETRTLLKQLLESKNYNADVTLYNREVMIKKYPWLSIVIDFSNTEPLVLLVDEINTNNPDGKTISIGTMAPTDVIIIDTILEYIAKRTVFTLSHVVDPLNHT